MIEFLSTASRLLLLTLLVAGFAAAVGHVRTAGAQPREPLFFPNSDDRRERLGSPS